MLFRFSNPPIRCIHSFASSFSRFLSLSFAHRVCTLTYIQIYHKYLYVSQEKKERMFMYTYVFSCVFPLKTPRTIGSMLSVFFMYNIMIFLLLCYIISVRIRALDFSEPSFADTSFNFYLYLFLCSIIRRIFKRTSTNRWQKFSSLKMNLITKTDVSRSFLTDRARFDN